MRFRCRQNIPGRILVPGFTLMEMLFVVAGISLLIALLLPVVHRVRANAKSLACKANLRNICVAWQGYLGDYEQRFYRANRANHDFGGWRGTGGYALYRILNKYVGLPSEIETESAAREFQCPADRGNVFNRPPQQTAYNYFGNSYQMNFLLVGPKEFPVSSFMPEHINILHQELNKRLGNLKQNDVSQPSRLLFVGDNNWETQRNAQVPEGISWHGRRNLFNVGFLDGRVDSVRILKGLYITDDYRVLPFAELDKLVPSD